MRWTFRGKNHEEWQRWWAWRPVSWVSFRPHCFADDQWAWCCWVERRAHPDGYYYREHP